MPGSKNQSIKGHVRSKRAPLFHLLFTLAFLGCQDRYNIQWNKRLEIYYANYHDQCINFP